MPGRTSSPYWATVDFESEGEEDKNAPAHRVYLDPWDNEAYGIIQSNTPESSQENFNSFVGEPVSASFYYVPTKTYDSEEEPPRMRRSTMTHEDAAREIYSRKSSRSYIPDYRIEPIYGDFPIRDRRRSMYIEEPLYTPHPMIYEPLYGPIVPPPPPGYLPPRPRTRMSLPHHPDYVMAALGHCKTRRHSRLTDAYEHFAYESLSPPEYEDWRFPKGAPENFHLSRYGHLQIDYSCSWNSLDRLIRNH